MEKLVLVAVVSRAQGMTGELQLRLETDQPDEVFRPKTVFTLDEAPVGLGDHLTVERARPHGRAWVVKFEEISDRGLAERYPGRRLLLHEDQLPVLEDDEFFLHDLVGLEVRDEAQGPVGEVTAVYDAAGRPLLAVRSEERERLVPFGREFVKRVDREAGVVWIVAPDGLLDL